MKALVVIDVQEGLFKRGRGVYRADEFLRNIIHLIDAARQAAAPVVMVRHSNGSSLKPGSEDWRIHHALRPFRDCLVIDKEHASCFHGTRLVSLLDERHVTDVVLSGLVTHGCVRASCFDGLSHGYSVTLVADGHSGYSRNAASQIKTWNNKFQSLGVILEPTLEVSFE